MKYKGIVSGIKTSKMSAKICKITFPDHGVQTANIIQKYHCATLSIFKFVYLDITMHIFEC
jgi:hypothetical protein